MNPRRRLAIGGGALGLALVIATVVVLIVDRGSSSKHAASSPSASSAPATVSSNAPSSTDTPTWTTASGTAAPPVSEPAARAVVEEYVGQVNARNRAGAAALICAGDLARWQQNADSPHGDFSYTVTGSQFLGSRPDAASHGIVVGYRLTFDDGTGNDVQFTVVEEKGPKLCGIKQL